MLTRSVISDPFTSSVTMSGRGKGGKVKGKAKSRSSRAGLQFPVGRIHRLLRYFCVALGGFITCRAGRVIMPRGSELVLQSTWQQSWSIWLPRSWSWLATLLGTTRNPASSLGIFSLPSGDFRPCFVGVWSSTQEWWGVEQAPGWRYHCTGWCLAQHPGSVAAQEEC